MKSLKQIFNVIVAFSTLSIIVFSCKKTNTENPLLNTEWKGMARIPQESEVILKFSNDKLDLLFENRVIESMKYTLKDNHIILEKISGGSPCEVGKKGEYNYEIIGDSFAINLFKDDCVARTASLKENIFTRTSTGK